jgi:hypothetical protein
MRLETKFLRLKTPVQINSHFGEWQVCWLGGGTKNYLGYVVMLVRLKPNSY